MSSNLLRKQGELMASVAELRVGDMRSRLDTDASDLEGVRSALQEVGSLIACYYPILKSVGSDRYSDHCSGV